MTLIRPLVNSLVKSNVSSIGGGGGLPSGATLEHYYPFASNLTDSITGDIGTLTRASTSTVTDINTGNPITYGIDQPAFNGVGGTGNAIGLQLGASPDNLQLDSSTWPVNDCWYYYKNIYQGGADTFSKVLRSEIDASHNFELRYRSDVYSHQIVNRVAGANIVTFSIIFQFLPGDVAEYLLINNSTTGMELFLYVNGFLIDNQQNTTISDFQLGSTMQMNATPSLNQLFPALASKFKNGAGSVTVEQARQAT